MAATQAILNQTVILQQQNVEALYDAVGRLTRAAQADRAEMRNATGRLDSLVSRLDTLVDYLMRQQ
ncbi:MAG: hypothetical protein F6K30_19275 [Cyanothece sp. SIO2G6]|nr:hypothetical protein [Cyanothece sp. SIO2G6]